MRIYVTLGQIFVFTSFLGDSIIVLEATEIEHLLRSYQSLFCIVLDMAIEFQLGVSENSVPLKPMVNDHYPY